MVKKDEKLNLIVEFLKDRYKAKVLIVVGSRAVGDYKPNSDWDIYLFTDKKLLKETPNQFYNSLPETIKHEDLDVYKNSMKINSFPPKLWRDLRNSNVLLDTNSEFGKKLRKKALDIYQKGPKKWTKYYAQGRVYKSQRYMKKFEDNLKDKNFAELFLRISWHYSENIIDWWFGIRQEFELRPQQAFPYIKEKDPKFYKQLQKIFSDKINYRTKINAFKKMHERLFESEKFKELIK
ncbi:nucleotidyltransferase domain-containing protein [archaeon]|jgi:predicted nucleotidyltransferase|nr:nucleotidyltransferase domain-containing protein [archaeon]MBT3450878.1 nucleotidyltransferase domain-containing protein [archaeon]MBT6869060.1 nucleotidyltransferase domain-containing protein [archaeon]MBT7193303.1 nucleotidyltransferase domain-containing protein [archaeon]MBT7380311.1 nucleotidyltransferase domain-containing protein [archaeon]